jgi:CheY-like chemotaxis protein
MSHELRTPLNSILGFGQLLEMDGVSESQREPVHYILESGRHLLELINEVLDISRIEAGNLTIHPKPVAVRALLCDVVAMVAPIAAERNIRVETEPLETERHVLADPQRLKQVLLNLLSNAIKYNRDGGEFRIACEQAGPRLRILVRDTGRGIPAERLCEVFAPFARLGAEPAVRLLYVEDSVANIKLVERILECRPSITVEATGQGRLGIELARHHQPDVIVLDLHLPDLAGEQILITFKSDARTERIPVIILTADASADQATRLRDLGADAYLTKPVDVPGFLAALDEVLLTGALVSK